MAGDDVIYIPVGNILSTTWFYRNEVFTHRRYGSCVFDNVVMDRSGTPYAGFIVIDNPQAMYYQRTDRFLHSAIQCTHILQ